MIEYEHIEGREAVIQSAIALGEFQATHVTIYLTLPFAYISKLLTGMAYELLVENITFIHPHRLYHCLCIIT